MSADKPREQNWQREIQTLIADFEAAGDDQWRDEYNDALDGAGTGNEAISRLNGFLQEMRQSDIAQRLDMDARIVAVIRSLYSRDPLVTSNIQSKRPQTAPESSIAADIAEIQHIVDRLTDILWVADEEIRCNDLDRARYGATGTEVFMNLMSFYWTTIRTEIGARPEVAEILQDLTDRAGRHLGTRRKRAAIPRPTYEKPYSVNADILRVYESADGLIAQLRGLGEEEQAESLHDVIYNPTWEGSSSFDKLIRLSSPLRQIESVTVTRHPSLQPMLAVLRQLLCQAWLVRGMLTIPNEEHEIRVPSDDLQRLRSNLKVLLEVFRAAGEEKQANWYANLIPTQEEISASAADINSVNYTWKRAYSSLWHLLREDVSRRLGIREPLNDLLKDFITTIRKHAPSAQ